MATEDEASSFSVDMSSFYNYSEIDYDTIYDEKFYIVPSFFTAIFLTGVIGNSLVVYVILKNGAMKTVTNLFLLNLAASDLVFLINTVPPSASEFLLSEWIFGEFLCRLRNYLSYVCYYVSVVTMTVMSVDRYYAVVHPMRSRIYRTLQHTVVILIVIWVVCLASSGYTVYISDEIVLYHFGEYKKVCIEWWTLSGRRKFMTSFFVLFYCLPLLTVMVSYILMARRLLVAVSPTMGSDDAQLRTVQTRRKIAHLVMGVVVAFALCYLPFHLFHLIHVWVDSYEVIFNEGFSVFGQFAKVLAFSNSCLNPLLYSFLSDNFRKHFKRACSPVNSCSRRLRVAAAGAPGSDPEAGPTNLTNPSLRRQMNTISLKVIKNNKMTGASGSGSSPSPTV